MAEPDWKAMGDPLNDRLPPKRRHGGVAGADDQQHQLVDAGGGLPASAPSAIVLDVTTGEVDYSAWCDECLLPSATSIEVEVHHQRRVTLWGHVLICDRCERSWSVHA